MVHVVPHPQGWAVLSEGNCRVTSVHETQEKAMKQAQQIMQRWRIHCAESKPNSIAGKIGS